MFDRVSATRFADIHLGDSLMQEALRHRPRVQITWVNERAAGRRIERLAFSCGAVQVDIAEKLWLTRGNPDPFVAACASPPLGVSEPSPLRHSLSGPFTRVRASALALAVASQ